MNSPDWPVGFMIIQGNRLEQLRQLLVQWSRRYPLHPLEQEVLLVQSNGIAQWLKLALAAPQQDGGHGIAAAVQTELPGRFLWQAYRAVLPELASESLYDKDILSWRLYRMLATLPDDNRYGALRGFLQKDPADPRRRYQLALKLADLFDQYQVYRADWLQQWQQGKDVLEGHSVPEDQLWQPLLWRAVVADIQQQNLHEQSRADVHQQFLTVCRSLQQRPAALPRRVVVFGISSLPRQTLQVLQAISGFCQVLLFVNNPCKEYWGDLIDGRDYFKEEYKRARRSNQHPLNKLSGDALYLAGNPLLASLGKQGRDYLHLLDEMDDTAAYQQFFNGKVDLFDTPAEQTLLQQVQADILQLRSAAERKVLTEAPVPDNSLLFIRCHSPMREVEVLHDQLLREFATANAAGYVLQPRDILVMVPDINLYAPYIEAVFGRLPSDDPRYLPYHIADQGQRHRNSLLQAFEHLLMLPESRFTVSEMLDFLDTPALKQRFSLNDTALAQLKKWIKGANIRWGLDARQRQTLGMPADLHQNSWLTGIQRMLLGYASGESADWQGIEPYDEVGGLDAALAGPLAQLLYLLQQSWQALQQRYTASQWFSLLQQQLQQYFLPQAQADLAVMAAIKTRLEQWLDHVNKSGLQAELFALAVVRETLLSELDKPTLQQRFLAGAINFATLMPMRAIPFQQVWLLGMNDGDYPRSVPQNDFDLMRQRYRPGDRARRDDDKYLFLEALLAARQKLVISWVGFSIRDNSEKTPSVLAGQLQDYLQAAYSESLLQQLTFCPPLQPFSKAYFMQGSDSRLFTYASEWHQAHLAVTNETEPPPLLTATAANITLADLAGFLRHPAKVLYQKRLGVYLQGELDTDSDCERFVAAKLEGFSLDDTLLRQVGRQLILQPDADVSQLLQQQLQRLQQAGELPAAAFATLLSTQKQEELTSPLQQWQQMLADSLPTAVFSSQQQCSAEPLIVFSDSLTDIRCQRHTQQHLRLVVQASRVTLAGSKGPVFKLHNLVRHWPAHLLAQLQAPTLTHIISPSGVNTLQPVAQGLASQLFTQLLAAYQAALMQPLPLACKTALAFLTAEDMYKAYCGDSFSDIQGESAQYPLLNRYWPTLDTLLADNRFEQLATTLYQPIVEYIDGFVVEEKQ